MSYAIQVCIRTTLLLLSAGLLSCLTARASASLRHAVWAAAIAGTLLLPIISIVLPVTRLEILPEKPAPPVVRPVAVSLAEFAPSSFDPQPVEQSAATNPSW